MRKLAVILLITIISNAAYARNNGFICITYLSKTGSLDISAKNKFTKKDFEKLANALNKKNIKNIGLKQYARGLYPNHSKQYETLAISEFYGPYFHNGIIYLETAGDMENDDMNKFKSIIGGKTSFKCEPME